ncbi:MAG: thioredoxin domain-containing protein [Leptolyngbyaceae cyanobacterium RU_5_1]|nr:thioredoxin domain-containing protein [Leptolyngbyaceae cyanobacterium RU_5_1]
MVNRQPILNQFRHQFSLRLMSVLALLIVAFGWSTPVWAANHLERNDAINPNLEKQVLQVIHQHPEAIWDSFQLYQSQQFEHQQKTQQALLQNLKSSPQSVIEQSPVSGATAQKIVLLEFADFQCPYCAKAHETVKQFMEQHQKDVTLVFKHLPLAEIHPEAIPAAKAAWAADRQGKFWQYQDALFAQQEQLGEARYVAIAKTLGLDLQQFNQDRQSVTSDQLIQKDVELAEQLGVSGTPSFVMNGTVFSGAVPLSELNRVAGTM